MDAAVESTTTDFRGRETSMIKTQERAKILQGKEMCESGPW